MKEQKDELTLSDYLAIIRKKRLFIISLSLILIIIATSAIVLQGPKCKATVDIAFVSEQIHLTHANVTIKSIPAKLALQFGLQILQSESLMKQVLKRLPPNISKNYVSAAELLNNFEADVAFAKRSRWQHNLTLTSQSTTQEESEILVKTWLDTYSHYLKILRKLIYEKAQLLLAQETILGSSLDLKNTSELLDINNKVLQQLNNDFKKTQRSYISNAVDEIYLRITSMKLKISAIENQQKHYQKDILTLKESIERKNDILEEAGILDIYRPILKGLSSSQSEYSHIPRPLILNLYLPGKSLFSYQTIQTSSARQSKKFNVIFCAGLSIFLSLFIALVLGINKKYN